MRTTRIRGCITLALVMVLMAAGAAFAGVGGSDVPTVPGHVEVGQTGIPFSFSITNQSTNPNQVNNMILTQFFFVTTCGSALTPAIGCLPGDQEAPNTIVINPLIATGVAGACIGEIFNVIPTANPNEYEFVPMNPIVIGPSNGSGVSSECDVTFTVDVLAAPIKDALPGTPDLQTAQLARVNMTDAVTAETGFAAGSSTVSVFEHCLHVEKSCTDAPTCEGAIGVSVTATNCGTEGLTDLVVTDDQAGALSCLATTLAAGESTTCTGSYSNIPGTYTDIITASAVSAISQATVLPNDTSILTDTCDIPFPPSVTAEKTCTSTDLACDATSATFNIQVCNDGTVDWTGTITDADCGINDQAIALAAGACTDIPCTVSGAFPAIVNNGGTVSVTASGCNDSATINSASCDVPPAPSVTAEKTCTSTDLACDATSATFNIQVCNDGTVDWTGTITDADCGVNAQAIALAAGACTDIPCTISGGAPAIVNSGGTVSVSANGCNDSATINSATCNIPPAPSVTAEKTCTSTDLACTATEATFNIQVCNDGTVDWTGTITDVDCGINDQAIALAAGACTDIPCTVSGAFPAIVNNGGTVSVSASGCNDSATINSASCTVPDCPPCQVVIEKTVALDDNCDGVADGPFVDDVTQDAGECVVYQICVTNTGEQVLDAAGVTVSDAHLGVVDFNFGTIAVGAPAVCQLVPSAIPAVQCPNSACVCEDVQGTNTAVISSAVCETTGDNACDQDGSVCSDTANVACVSEAICRTPGFWGTHAGTADNKKNSQNITQAVIDACDGCLDVCGEIITNTDLDSANSAIEAICVSPSGDIRHQLARQLTSMALNCCISGFGSDCLGDASLSELFNSCNIACSEGTSEINECIFKVDCFNNGGVILENGSLFCQTGTCANDDPCNGAPCADGSACTPLPGNCHDRELCNESLGLCFEPPGPAGSSNACTTAKGDGKGKKAGNDCAVLPKASSDDCSKFNQGEECCGSDVEGSCEACAHDLCTTNGPLSASCDPCVALICAEDSFCCEVAWDGFCVSEVGTICGTPCDGAAGVSTEISR